MHAGYKQWICRQKDTCKINQRSNGKLIGLVCILISNYFWNASILCGGNRKKKENFRERFLFSGVTLKYAKLCGGCDLQVHVIFVVFNAKHYWWNWKFNYQHFFLYHNFCNKMDKLLCNFNFLPYTLLRI